MNNNHSPFLDSSPLQKALNSGATPQTLKDDLGIRFSVHPKYTNLILFVYDQIDSPKMNPIVQASRGHILDSSNGWTHVCRPFDRFLNWGEGIPGTTPLPDLKESVVYKKEDGSLVNLWWYAGKWNVSTKGSPSAGGSVGDFPFTFEELFLKTFAEMGLSFPDDEDSRNYTFTFELLCSENRVVCPQSVNKVALLSVRHNETGVELDPNGFESFPICESFEELKNTSSIEDVKSTFLSINALDLEGYVVAQYMANGSVVRSKIKHPGYLALAHLKGGTTRKSLLELKRSGEEGEFLSIFPESKDLFDDVSQKYEALVSSLEEAWRLHKDIESQKDFALAIKGTPGCNVLFSLRKAGGTIREHLAKVSIDSLASLLFKGE